MNAALISALMMRLFLREEDGGNLDSALTETPKGDLPFGLISSLGDLSDGVGYADGTYLLPALGGSGTGADSDCCS